MSIILSLSRVVHAACIRHGFESVQNPTWFKYSARKLSWLPPFAILVALPVVGEN